MCESLLYYVLFPISEFKLLLSITTLLKFSTWQLGTDIWFPYFEMTVVLVVNMAMHQIILCIHTPSQHMLRVQI